MMTGTRPGTPLLELDDIEVRYGRVQILFGVSLTVAEGEFVAMLGTNGAGKSTVLKAISNLAPTSGGSIRFDGQDLASLAPEEIVELGVGHVPGGRGLLADLSVEENLRLGGHLLRGAALAEGLDRAMTLFPWFSERRKQLAGTLSGGQQQMLAIGRALVTQPRLLMVDELSLGLAPIVVEELFVVLDELHRAGSTVLIVEQHATLAMAHAERVLFLEKGRVRFSGAAADMAGRTDLLRSVYLGG
ncbi:MAG: ABC transporter ATP-binding protein [Acidimicrobiales bacterium]